MDSALVDPRESPGGASAAGVRSLRGARLAGLTALARAWSRDGMVDGQDQHGCEACRAGDSVAGMLRDVEDVAHRFAVKHDYFSVRLLECQECAAHWLRGYYEDFTNTSIEDEFGDRTWILRPMSHDQVMTIRAPGPLLDIDTFGLENT